MSDEGATKDPAGQQPEFVKGLKAATQSGGQKPPEHSENAIPATQPETESPVEGQSKAAAILNQNATKDTQTGS